MTDYLSAELTAACNALGYFDKDTNKYHSDENTLETCKDLIRYLRRDDDTYDIRRQLGDIKVIQTDLLPLLKNYWDNNDLFDVLLRLLVNLTTPPLILWQGKIPTEKITRNYYLQIENHLQNYKKEFVDDDIWAILGVKLSKILELDDIDRSNEDSLVIERILILIRNILYAPNDNYMTNKPDDDADVHDQVLWALHQSGVFNVLLYISCSTNEGSYYLHILEILSFAMRGQKASNLAKATLPRSETDKKNDETELLSIRNKETNDKQRKMKKFSGARHSRFGGTFVLNSIKSISDDNNLIYHKPLNKLDELNFDADKRKPKTPKNRAELKCNVYEHHSALGIRLFLKRFCVEFLNGAYNNVMYHVKGILLRAKGQTHDESYYLWAMRFFMEFNRHHKFEVKLISATVSIDSFNFIQKQIENYLDILNVERKLFLVWTHRLHIAILAYQELLFTLHSMDKSSDEEIRKTSEIIKSNIFYILEYRELILTLLVIYDPIKMSNIYLNDLMETQHIFVKLLEQFCKQDSVVIVQGKRQKSRKKVQKSGTKKAPKKPFNCEENWNRVAPQLAAILNENLLIQSDIIPFDATSDIPIDNQKAIAMSNIQMKLHKDEYEEAIGLLRAAREVWPENDCFGNSNMNNEEEFSAIKDIYMAELGNEIDDNNDGNETNEREIEPIYNCYDEEENEDNERITETDFKFEDFLKRLANPRIIKACSLALRKFQTNSIYTNQCIVKLLHRIAFDCKMYVMVFHVSFFITFKEIFEFKDVPKHKELVKFATYIINKFIKVAQKNDKVYMEALFSKTSKECYDIENGYGSYQEKTHSSKNAWSEAQEDELRQLFMEYKETDESEDMVDWIMRNLVDNTRTRRAVIKKLKELCLLSEKIKKPPLHWSEEEEIQLTDLYEKFKDEDDPLNRIMENLEIKRSKNRIVEKLLVMGLIHDRKQVYKKKRQKSRLEKELEKDIGLILDSSEDESDQDTRSQYIRKETKKKSKKRVSQSSVSSAEIVQFVRKIYNLGMGEALIWLKQSFIEAAEDDSDDDDDDVDEDIPLVPVTDEAINAITNDDFQGLLKILNIIEPSSVQESFWRIPITLSPLEMKNKAKLIDSVINNPLDDNINDVSLIESQKNQSSSDDGSSNEEENRSNEDDRSPNNSQDSKKSTDNNPNSSSDQSNNIKSQQKKLGRNKSINHVFDSSSDEGNKENNIIIDRENNKEEIKQTRTRYSDSDEELHTTIKKRRIIVSDDENE